MTQTTQSPALSHDFSKLTGIFERHSQDASSLIMILQDIQKEYRYLPCEALKQAAEYLQLPLSKVFSVATFYNAFSLNPKGEKVVRVCMGTACHIRGAGLILDQISNHLGIKAGETTEDGKFSLEVVACVGACAMAPVVIVNEEYHGSVKVSGAKRLVRDK